MQLGIDILQNDWYKYSTYRIYSDSKATMKVIDKLRRQSGQAIIKKILDSIDDIMYKHSQLRITIVWILEHYEIEGNK